LEHAIGFCRCSKGRQLTRTRRAASGLRPDRFHRPACEYPLTRSIPPVPRFPMTQNSLPLAGVRVLDLSRILAGPWCAMVLADLGAEVIKVEHPKRGDDTRDWSMRIGKTETAYFNCVNRNKRSVTLDLQTPEGQQIARELADKSDVVIHNFKFGGIERL